MDDAGVIDAFLEGSAAAFGPSIHLEQDTLRVDGWWQLAYRASRQTFIVRDEEAPDGSTAVTDVAAALGAKGFSVVGRDLPAVAVLTYTKLDIGYAPWVVWSSDLATGEADLNAKATEDTSLDGGWAGGWVGDPAVEPSTTDHARGARRLAGAPSRILLAVGLAEPATSALRENLADCWFEIRALDEIDPGDCASLLPTLILVDATTPPGTAFVADLLGAPDRHAPVVAITANGDMRPGADATVDAAHAPESWTPLIGELLR